MRVTHQLLNDPLHQGGEGHAVIFPVVVNVLDQLGDDLRVRLGLKLITLVDLPRMRETIQGVRELSETLSRRNTVKGN